MGGNGVQRIPVTVRAGVGVARSRVPSATQAVVDGGEVPPEWASARSGIRFLLPSVRATASERAPNAQETGSPLRGRLFSVRCIRAT